MNNELAVKGLNLAFIPPERKQAFVEEVLEGYFKQCIDISNSINEHPLPSIAFDYGGEIDREFYTSMIAHDQGIDEKELTESLNEHKVIEDYHEHLLDNYGDEEYNEMFSEQIIEVLEYHRLSYLTSFYNGISGTLYTILNNVHCTEVW